MANKIIARIKGFITPTDLWVCHYWKMDDPERLSETFPTQLEAHECELKRSNEGYVALIRFEGTKSHEGLIVSALQAIAGMMPGSNSSSSKSEGQG